MTAAAPSLIKLGLIGDNINRSKSPRLHRTAGALTGQQITYDRLIPKDMGLTFDEVFDQAYSSGFRGINITYPYKETVTAKVTVSDPLVRAIGAVNTVVFNADGPKGFNTDYTGFMSAYMLVRGDQNPGTVCLIGTGGVGKAVAFGLIGLNARTIRCVDLDSDKAKALADALRALGSATRIETANDAVTAAHDVDGIVNCTPLGMVGIGGTPLPAEAMQNATWVFDAVYTPIDTQFLQDATRSGLAVISGYELFFGQGVDAWDIFTGIPLDQAALRDAIQGDEI
ncbi:shikimate dehydrogenase [Puniceibacterium sp. IMCC21224]|uniref:shikimate dehydrogenase family protein n=1 Tax=Puniceibacterium sp. IMCC21224 TaxID=1618204 RepID=UPI00064DA263|nr:shikimate dehydrogenase [Puniceibacterium sp. IMCC21224]KMK65057.1 shikimate dehydrogenase [Puniceibacterium sp. IMCC21224]